MILTGTPIDQTETELWAQFRFLNPELFGTAWQSFDKKFLRKSGYMGHGRKFKRGWREKMLDMIKPYVYRISAAEALDLPPVTDKAIYFDLTGKAKKAYADLERDFLHRFGELTSTTPLAITQMIRLQQLTGGFLGMDDGSLLQLEQDKLIALSDWLEDVGRDEKLVIFAKHTSEIDMLAELMKRHKRSYIIRDGRTKRGDLRLWEKFQDEDDPNVYIGQIASGGIGVDLFRSRIGIFYSKSFSYIDVDQARKRLDRNGQTRPVLFIHMIGKNTIDELIQQDVDAKCLTTENLFNHLKEREHITMAKDTKTAKAPEPAADKKKSNLPEKPTVAFGVKELAAALSMEAGDVRVLLRANDYADTYKKEGSWNFGSQKNIDSIAKALTKAKADKDKVKAEKEAADAKAAATKTAPAAAAAPAKGAKKAA
jgi:superfamily II DNA or RNA helicase